MCGIFGYVNYGNCISEAQIRNIYAEFSKVCVARGSHACGIAYVPLETSVTEKHVDVSAPIIQKKRGLLTEAGFTYPWETPSLAAHCRLSLDNGCGNSDINENNHPFLGAARDGTAYALEHNGILSKLNAIRKNLQLAVPKITTDSYIIAQILDTQPRLDCETLKNVCEQLCGSYSFTVLDETGNLYFCRGDVPVYMIHFKALKFYLYISTRDLFETALAQTDLWDIYKTSNLEAVNSKVNIIPLNKGDILRISPKGETKRAVFSFREETAILHNWYSHTITITPELKEQLENLDNC